MAERVDHMHNLEVMTNLVGVQDGLDNFCHLMTNGILPLAGGDLGETLQAGNSEPVFLRPIRNPVGELGVHGRREVGDGKQTIMPIIEVGHPVNKLSNTLTNERQLGISTNG